jgi:hypothetical protein
MHFSTARLQAHQPIDDPGRLWAPIHQIAQEDQRGAGGLPPCIVAIDPQQQVIDKVEPTMNVTHGIHTLTQGNSVSGGLGLFRPSEKAL